MVPLMYNYGKDAWMPSLEIHVHVHVYVHCMQAKYLYRVKVAVMTLPCTQPSGRGSRLPEVTCLISPLGCFSLYEKVRTFLKCKQRHFYNVI